MLLRNWKPILNIIQNPKNWLLPFIRLTVGFTFDMDSRAKSTCRGRRGQLILHCRAQICRRRLFETDDLSIRVSATSTRWRWKLHIGISPAPRSRHPVQCWRNGRVRRPRFSDSSSTWCLSVPGENMRCEKSKRVDFRNEDGCKVRP